MFREPDVLVLGSFGALCADFRPFVLGNISNMFAINLCILYQNQVGNKENGGF